MSIGLILILLILLVVIFSQFGGKVSATSAWQWWVVGIFLVIAAYEPEIYRPIAQFLGIKFISNFVLASLVMFLFVQGLSVQATTSGLLRNQRRLVSAIAVNNYVTKTKPSAVPSTLVILPAFNEQDSLERVFHELMTLKKQSPSLHFCFVNDGSTDRTQEILQGLGDEYSMTHLSNTGVSGVLKSGFDLAHILGVQFVVQCDADGQHPIGEIPNLVAFAEQNQFDCVIGSRFLSLGFMERLRDDSSSILRGIGGQSLHWALLVLFRAKVTDPTSGFRVYTRAAIHALRNNLPDEYPEPESIAIMSAAGLKISEIPVRMNPRTAGVSSISGIKSIAYMSKVISALLGLRLRQLVA